MDKEIMILGKQNMEYELSNNNDMSTKKVFGELLQAHI